MFFPEPLSERVLRASRSRSIMKGWFLGPPANPETPTSDSRGSLFRPRCRLWGGTSIYARHPGAALFRFLRILIDIYVFSRFLEIFIDFGPILDRFGTDFGPILERF